MRTTTNLDPEHKIIYLLQFIGNTTLKIITGVTVYFLITRYTSLDARQLVAVVIAMIAAGKVSLTVKTNQRRRQI